MAVALLETVFRISRKGQIASLRIDAVTNETHSRTSELTNFPIEDGAAITDHVKLDPISIEIDGFISDAPVAPLGIRAIGDVTRNIRNALLPGRFENDDDVPNSTSRSPLDAWEYLNKVWRDRNLIVVVSSLQVYRNMILTSLSAPKSARIGKSLEFRASLREVRILESEEIFFPTLEVGVDEEAKKKLDARARAAKKNNKGRGSSNTATKKQTDNVKGKSFLASIFGGGS